MGYLGRRIGLSQDQGDSNPGGADGAVGGGILNLFENGYFERQGDIYNAPAASPSGHTATGGVISDYTQGSDVYRAHIFTSSGEFDVTALGNIDSEVEYILVAGGGSGGAAYSAGGGAGQVLGPTPTPVSVATYPVVIGGGGACPSGPHQPNQPNTGADGTDSTWFGQTANGGGGGAGQTDNPAPNRVGRPGGSGGGGATDWNSGAGPNAGGTATPGPGGNPGGASLSSLINGGGGGAGGAGVDGIHPPGSSPYAPGQAGHGGLGVRVTIAGPTSDPSPIGYPGPGSGASATGWVAGGGGGGGGPAPGGSPGGGDGGAGPAGGGNPYAGAGPGGRPDNRLEKDAQQNSGSGGGGYWSGTAGTSGGFGGSGLAVVRYKIGSVSTAKATGGAISFHGGKTIHTFTSSGTFATTSDWSPTNVEYVVVGGGGAGNGGPGPSCGGGGGAGGFITNTNHPIGTHPVLVTVQIGAGAGAAPNTRTGGTPSYFGSPLTAYGGGGGGRHINSGGSTTENGMPGGSGGGECDSGGPIGAGVGSKQTDTTTDAPITPQGNPGGAGSGNGGVTSVSGGGGGGAGQAGQAALPGSPRYGGGDGGYGKQLPATFQNPQVAGEALGTGPNPTRYNGPNSGFYWFAGGGGGASSAPPDNFGLDAKGGLGGGGRGFTNPSPSLPTSRTEMDAIQNTGGGGGAVHGPAGGESAGQGGSGIVLIAYPT